MSEQAERVSRARELGLPTNSDEAVGNTGNEDKTPLADRASSERQLTGLLDFVRKAAFGVCARVDGDECCFFVREIENFCVTCHARELLDDTRTNFRVRFLTATQPLFADASVIRAAIMDVIESGDPTRYTTQGELGAAWLIYDLEEECVNEKRLRFADAVEKRVRELQSPPFSLGIKIENFCDRHKRLRLPPPTSSSCSDCASELEKRRINDPD